MEPSGVLNSLSRARLAHLAHRRSEVRGLPDGVTSCPSTGSVACLLFYIFASDFLGFLICGILILSAMFAALEVRAKWILPIAVVVTFVVHTIFYKGLRVPLPWGLFTPIQW